MLTVNYDLKKLIAFCTSPRKVNAALRVANWAVALSVLDRVLKTRPSWAQSRPADAPFKVEMLSRIAKVSPTLSWRVSILNTNS